LCEEGLELPPPPQPASARAININTPAARGRNTVRRLALTGLEARMVQAMPAKSTPSISRAWRPNRRGWGGGKVHGGLADGAVVVTLTVILLVGVAEFGETVQVASEGAPVQEKLTLWLNPSSAPRLNMNVAVWPGKTVCDDEDPEAIASVKS